MGQARPVRTRRRALTSAPTVLALSALLACTAGPGREDSAPAGSPSARPAGYRSCPTAYLRPVPPGFRLLDRQTVNLGDNLMGIHIEYGDGTAVFSVDVGFDRLDALEDVDFQTYGIGVLGGRRVEVVRSTVFAARGPLWGASWTEKGADPGCAEVTAVGREMSLAAFRAAVTAVRVG